MQPVGSRIFLKKLWQSIAPIRDGSPAKCSASATQWDIGVILGGHYCLCLIAYTCKIIWCGCVILCVFCWTSGLFLRLVEFPTLEPPLEAQHSDHGSRCHIRSTVPCRRLLSHRGLLPSVCDESHEEGRLLELFCVLLCTTVLHSDMFTP